MISSSDLPYYILVENEDNDESEPFLPVLIKYLISYTKEKIPTIKSEDNIVDVIIEANQELALSNRESFFANYTDYLASILFNRIHPRFDSKVLINRKGVNLSPDALKYYKFINKYLENKYEPYLRTLLALSALIKSYKISDTLDIALEIDKIIPVRPTK